MMWPISNTRKPTFFSVSEQQKNFFVHGARRTAEKFCALLFLLVSTHCFFHVSFLSALLFVTVVTLFFLLLLLLVIE